MSTSLAPTVLVASLRVREIKLRSSESTGVEGRSSGEKTEAAGGAGGPSLLPSSPPAPPDTNHSNTRQLGLFTDMYQPIPSPQFLSSLYVHYSEDEVLSFKFHLTLLSGL